VNQDRFLESPQNVITTNLDEEGFQLIDKIRERGEQLERYGEASRGIETGNNEKYLFDTEREDLKPIVRGRNVGEFCIKGEEYLLYEEEELNNPGDREEMESPKIILQQNSEAPTAFYDGIYVLNSCTYIQGEEENLPAITGILNSKLMEFYFKASYTNFAHLTINILPNNLHSLPVVVDGSLGEKVRKIQDKKEEFQAMEVNPSGILNRYVGGSTVTISEILDEASFVNEIGTESSASIDELEVDLNDDLVTISAEV
ncbi:MAG: TaqI-like C-terminal specificity domain-containing protein, partial [Candidatus Aenigmatarchaeota archaeon]